MSSIGIVGTIVSICVALLLTIYAAYHRTFAKQYRCQECERELRVPVFDKDLSTICIPDFKSCPFCGGELISLAPKRWNTDSWYRY